MNKKSIELCEIIANALTELAEEYNLNHISATFIKDANCSVYVTDLTDINNKKVDFSRRVNNEQSNING